MQQHTKDRCLIQPVASMPAGFLFSAAFRDEKDARMMRLTGSENQKAKRGRLRDNGTSSGIPQIDFRDSRNPR
jgi:hypothetical protein